MNEQTGMMTSSASIRLCATAVPAASFAPTGRYIHGRDSCWASVQGWAQLASREELAAHPLRAALDTALQSARLYDGNQIQAYRGRLFAEGNKPSRDEMGSPPVAYHGRYNDAGRMALYLSESPEGVCREVSTKPRKPVLWVQSFTLKLDALRIVDFRLSAIDDFLNHVFWWSETTEGYLFSQFVAGRVAQSFDGMIVPGVRGDQSTRYHNIVIFNPEGWRDWLSDGTTPKRMVLP